MKMESNAGSDDYKKTPTTVAATAPAGSKETPKLLRTSKSVLYGRLLVVTGLAAVAAALGYTAYYLMSDSEEQLAEGRFESITERALSIAQLVIEEKKLTTDSLAHVAAAANPNAEAWPNVYIEGFEEIATSLRLVTEGQGVSFCPIVQPGGEEQTSFENFSYDLFENVRKFDNDPGVNGFGKGVYAYGNGPYGNESYPDTRYHQTSGWTYYGSPNDVLVPFIQSDQGYHPALMLNVHFEHNRGNTIDDIIRCSEERAASGDYRECGSITDLMWSVTNHDVDPGPAGIMFVPIYPKFDNITLTGFIVAKTIWQDLLKHGFETDVNGLDCVLRTENNAHTYRIEQGVAVYVGPGDLHDDDALFRASAHINPNYFSNSTVKYFLEIYSTDEFVNFYSTNNPRTACIGAVAIMVFTSLLFFFYDFFVRKEFHSKKNLLESKRQFVRFVSHEVRTPLNTVCMGLTLLQDDFATVLGLRRDARRKTRSNHADKSNNTNKEQFEEWLKLSNQVYRNAEAAVSVLNDLLNYDKIQMGTLTLELSLIPIWSALDKTVSEFKISSMEKNVKLEIDFSPLVNNKDKDIEAEGSLSKLPQDIKDCRIVGDNIRFAQVLRNLISNGLKFSKDNGNLTIRVSEQGMQNKRKVTEEITLENGEQTTLPKRGTVVIEVIDDGVGMTPDQVRTVFNDGTQFNANQFQAGGGSGLGLSIAKGIVTQHGGFLACASEGMGKGSTFTLSLPLYDSNEQASFRTASTKFDWDVLTELEAVFDIPELNILVVDDSNTNRKLCVRMLEKHGHTCASACDGNEAIQSVKEALEKNEPYDCILLDYEMPNMNGPEACENIRKMGCSAYIVGVTGNVMSEDVAHFRNCGANWVLPKPFRLEALEQKWIDDGLTAHVSAHAKNDGMIRVESGSEMK